MPEPQQHQEATEAAPRFRLDVQLHELLMQPAAKPAAPPAEKKEPQELPEPVFPCRPELQKGTDEDYIDADGKRHWTVPQIMHAMHGWALPYFKSRLLPGAFHPIISYLFTEWKCNLDCHYCWAFENSVKGMTEDVAKRSIDWLLSTTSRTCADGRRTAPAS
jgi:sulfatase maturation enzyme AslB (radical SAM superfamily)